MKSVWMSGVLFGLAALAACGPSSQYEPSSPEPGNYPQQAQAYPTAGSPPPAPADGDFEVGVSAKAESRPSSMDAPAPATRPGLGTEWGETRDSRISSTSFVRADSSTPLATAALFYNDEQGAKAMANTTGFRRMSNGGVEIGGGIATMSLKDGAGRFLTGFEASGQRFLIGEAGERYTIVIESHAPARIEVVVTVDGLDVLDGKEGSFKKRGYVVEARGIVEIDGFRQSRETVAAFRFGSVRDSYASQKHGETRNVGVIGVAAFNEQGSSPSTWNIGDTRTRLQADPFPGRFATPP